MAKEQVVIEYIIENDQARKSSQELVSDANKISETYAKAVDNANDLKKSLELLAKSSGEVSLKNFNADEVINDSAKLKKLIDELNGSLKGMKQGTTEFNALDSIIKSANVQLVKLNVTSEATGKSLRTQMREAQQQVALLSDKFGATSKQAIEAAKRAAELKDRIGDAKNLTDAFNPDAKFSALSKSITGLASGFSAVEGAMGLLGSESEDVQKTLLKVQSALALSQGLQGLGEAKDSFIQLKAVAVSSFAAIRTAIGLTGIGALVVGVGALITAIVEYGTKSKDAFDREYDTLGKINKLHEAKKNLLEIQEQLMKSQGKSEREILEVKKRSLAIAFLEQKSQFDKLKSKLDEARLENEKFKKFKSAGFSLTGSLFYIDDDELKKIEDRTKTAQNELLKSGTEFLSVSNQIRDIDKKASEDAQKQREKNADDYVKNLQRIEKANADTFKKMGEDAKLLGKISFPLSEEEIKRNIKEMGDSFRKNAELMGEISIPLDEEKIKRNLDLLEKGIGDAYKRGFMTYEDFLKEKIASLQKSIDSVFSVIQPNILVKLGIDPQSVEALKKNIETLSVAFSEGAGKKPIEKLAAVAGVANQTYNLVTGAIRESEKRDAERQLEEISRQQEEELRLAGDNEQKKEIIRQKFDLKRREIKRKEAEAEKRKAIFDATINGANAVLQAAAGAPPPFNIPLIAAMVALTAAQIGLIVATPLPKFEDGGKIKGKRHSRGGEIVEVEDGERIFSREKTIKYDGLLEAVDNGYIDKYINQHFVMPALEKEQSIKEVKQMAMIEATTARVVSQVLLGNRKNDDKNFNRLISKLDKNEITI